MDFDNSKPKNTRSVNPAPGIPGHHNPSPRPPPPQPARGNPGHPNPRPPSPRPRPQAQNPDPPSSLAPSVYDIVPQAPTYVLPQPDSSEARKYAREVWEDDRDQRLTLRAWIAENEAKITTLGKGCEALRDKRDGRLKPNSQDPLEVARLHAAHLIYEEIATRRALNTSAKAYLETSRRRFTEATGEDPPVDDKNPRDLSPTEPNSRAPRRPPTEPSDLPPMKPSRRPQMKPSRQPPTVNLAVPLAERGRRSPPLDSQQGNGRGRGKGNQAG